MGKAYKTLRQFDEMEFVVTMGIFVGTSYEKYTPFRFVNIINRSPVLMLVKSEMEHG